MASSDDILGLGIALFTLGAASKIFSSVFGKAKDNFLNGGSSNWLK